MDGWSQFGKWFLIVGIGLAVLGGVLLLAGRVLKETKIPWLGRLPGDIRIERRGLSCYFPLATSILLSLILTVILNIIVRLLRRP